MLDVAADGTARGVVRARIGADTFERAVSGTLVAQNGRVVVDLVEAGRSRESRYAGVIEAGTGSGSLLVNGRERTSWTMRRQ